MQYTVILKKIFFLVFRLGSKEKFRAFKVSERYFLWSSSNLYISNSVLQGTTVNYNITDIHWPWKLLMR
jgi:hypothetical protein